MHERVYAHRQSSEINGIIVDFPRRSLIQQNACRCRNFRLLSLLPVAGHRWLLPGRGRAAAARPPRPPSPARIHEQHARRGRLGNHRASSWKRHWHSVRAVFAQCQCTRIPLKCNQYRLAFCFVQPHRGKCNRAMPWICCDGPPGCICNASVPLNCSESSARNSTLERCISRPRLVARKSVQLIPLKCWWACSKCNECPLKFHNILPSGKSMPDCH